MEFQSTCQQDTKKFGQDLAKTLKPGDILTLTGDLGSGKTTLTQSIAETLGITEPITSPTFTLINVYSVPENNAGIKTLIHVDTYRLEHHEDLIEIGIEEYLNDEHTVSIIEWPEKIRPLLKNKKTIDITIEQLSETERTITVSR